MTIRLRSRDGSDGYPQTGVPVQCAVFHAKDNVCAQPDRVIGDMAMAGWLIEREDENDDTVMLLHARNEVEADVWISVGKLVFGDYKIEVPSPD